jgi:hypothetical protein
MEQQLVTLLKDEPNKILTEVELASLVDVEFAKKSYPTPGAMDASLLELPEENADLIPFTQGQWVEYLGFDMNWYLAMVKRVVKVAPDDWDFDDPRNAGKEVPWRYFLNVGKLSMLEPREVRAPEEALKRFFGFRPWIWQQWACLKIESTVRFQHQHERDFERFNFRLGAEKLWKMWLADPRNADFKACYEARPSHVQEKLLNHILSPFWLMDEMSKDEHAWNFEDAGLSIYEYPSFLGSGFITVLVVFAIQLMVPVILLFAVVTDSPRFAQPYPSQNITFDPDTNETLIIENIDPDTNQTIMIHPPPFTINSWDEFCNKSGSFDARIMNLAVLMVYLVRVIPSTLFAFYNTAGEADTVNSKLKSMRHVIWLQADDTIWMQVGYKMAKYMNSLYISLLMTLMLFILFLTDNTVDIILNALAIEFVAELDEELAEGDWFDPEQRYIKAGAVEMVIRATLRLEWLEIPRAFCAELDFPEDAYEEALGGNKMQSLWDLDTAYHDKSNPEFMSPKDRLWYQAGEYAINTGNKAAIAQFTERLEHFGMMDRVLQSLGILNVGIFQRYPGFACWSHWEKILYLAPCPLPGEKYNSDILASNRDDKLSDNNSLSASQSRTTSRKFSLMKRGLGPSKSPYINFSLTTDYSGLTRFILDILYTVLLQAMIFAVKVACRRKMFISAIFRLLDGIFEVFAYVYQVCFPFVLILFGYLVVECY